MISQTLTVSDFIEKVKAELEDQFSSIWIRGEISQVTRAASGHIYFVIKDSLCSVRAVMFRNKAYAFQSLIKEGAQIDMLATPSIYEARGEFQLLVDAIRQAGSGQLYEQFLRLKSKLAAEGLFDEHRKKPLPDWPKTVGIITSLQAAALRDVISVFRRRNPGISLIVYPASVQGVMAASEIIAMLKIANAQKRCDALILCRGGGAFEDLAVFNNEDIARQIAATDIPVVSAIGHETDVTIADFVADLRAATPTAAAERLSPCLADTYDDVNRLLKRVKTAFLSSYRHDLNRLALLQHRLLSPQQKIDQQQLTLRHHVQRIISAIHRQYQEDQYHCTGYQARIINPKAALAQRKQRLSYIINNIKKTLYYNVNKQKNILSSLSIRTKNTHPDHILLRGYSITYDSKGNIISSLSAIKSGDRLLTKVADGSIESQVQNIHKITKK